MSTTLEEMNRRDIAWGYLTAKHLVTDAGYGQDIIWAEDLARVLPNPRYVLQEHAWVVVNSGFRYSVAKKLWPRLIEAFRFFDPGEVTRDCIPPAREVLNHTGKLEAICKMAAEVRESGIDQILEDAADPPRLTRLPWIGKITCYHFAKVLGIDCVKPDVHLCRAAEGAGVESPLRLCEIIRDFTGDRLTVVDSVLWRYGEQRVAQGWVDWNDLLSS